MCIGQPLPRSAGLMLLFVCVCACDVGCIVAEHLKAKFHYAILVADLFAVGLSQILLRYPGRKQVQSWSQTCSELEFGLSSSSLAAS